MNAPLRLTPTMSSREHLALQFIEAYWERRGAGPSYGEISAALGGISRGRVHDIVDKLTQRGRIGRRPGKARSITVPSTRERALRALLAEGWTIADVQLNILLPAAGGTNTGLPLVPELVHIPYLHGGDQHDRPDDA